MKLLSSAVLLGAILIAASNLLGQRFGHSVYGQDITILDRLTGGIEFCTGLDRSCRTIKGPSQLPFGL